jgi:hypothetical protein
VDWNTVVTTVGSLGGATVAGSGGSSTSASRVTVRTTVSAFPSSSAAMTVIWLPPSTNATTWVNAPA